MSRTHAAAAGSSLLAFVCLVTLSLLTAGCGRRDEVSEISAPANTPVVLISIDTLRADRLPVYGYDSVETPAIDALREDSILFEHAFSHNPLTLPSHVSLLSGRVPPFHGVRDNMGYRLGADGGFYLPAALQQAGYHTGAAVSSFVLRSDTGLGRGFELYEDRLVGDGERDGESVQRAGDATLEAAAEWLQSVADGPFFFFFHIYEPHSPYEPPEPFASRYESPYDGEVATADRTVGKLIAKLRDLGVYDRALVVLLSDHGEGLGDHGLEDHGLFLYREALQVPLMLKLPSNQLAGRSVARAAQLIDVAPTLASLLGIEVDAELPGTSLLDLIGQEGPERAIYSDTYFPWVHYGWSPLFSIIRFPHHLIQGPDAEVFDLAADPAEEHDLYASDKRLYASLRRELLEYPRELERPEPEERGTRERLAALGYLGSAAGAADGPLADPKSKLPVARRLAAAFELYRQGEHARAAQAFSQLLTAEPGLADAWEMLGKTLLELGRPEEAVEAFRRLVEVTGGAPEAALSMANALTSAGRLEEARQYAEIAAGTDPNAFTLLAQIALADNRLDTAGEHLNQAIDRLGRRPGLLLLRAQILMAGTRYQEALAAVGEAESLTTESSRIPHGLYRIRAEALANLGRPEEAAASFIREIEIFPDDLAAYTRLAVLYALAGEAQATRNVLQRMVEANPAPAAYAEAVRTLRVLQDPDSAERLLSYARGRWPESPELRSMETEGPSARVTMPR